MAAMLSLTTTHHWTSQNERRKHFWTGLVFVTRIDQALITVYFFAQIVVFYLRTPHGIHVWRCTLIKTKWVKRNLEVSVSRFTWTVPSDRWLSNGLLHPRRKCVKILPRDFTVKRKMNLSGGLECGTGKLNRTKDLVDWFKGPRVPGAFFMPQLFACHLLKSSPGY